MSSQFDFERQLTDWLDAQAPMREPDGLTYAVLARTRRTRRLPSWASLERWLPMAVITQPTLAPPMRLAWLALLLVLTVALTVGTIVVGSRLLATTPAIPQGGEALYVFSALSNHDIYTVRADGTDLRRLTTGSPIETLPVWSPDGTRIAFWEWDQGMDSAAVMDGEGSNRTTLFSTEAWSIATVLPAGYDESLECNDRRTLEWAPDGTSLLLADRQSCTIPRFELTVVSTSGPGASRRLLEPGLSSLGASWSPDKTRIAFYGQPWDEQTAQAVGAAGLYVVDATPVEALAGGLTGARRIGPDLSQTLEELLWKPEWSPDGKEIVVMDRRASNPFGSDGAGLTYDTDRLIAITADGSGERQMAEFASNAAWSPDGTTLAFQRPVDESEQWRGRPCTVRTWLVDADGANARQLDEIGDGCGWQLSWAPDGTRLASMLIDTTAPEPTAYHLGLVTPDGSRPAVTLQAGIGVNWQPMAALVPSC